MTRSTRSLPEPAPPVPDQARSHWRLLAALVVLIAGTAAAIGPLGLLERRTGAESGASPSIEVSGVPAPSTDPSRPADLPTASLAGSSDELAFADAYRALAETHDRQATDLLIANPLAEFDLVGARLIDLIDESRQRLAGLPPFPGTTDPVRDLQREMAAALVLLRAVDPHGPPSEKAATYQRALDYWVEHVQPVSDAIRAALGLPPSASGDLQL